MSTNQVLEYVFSAFWIIWMGLALFGLWVAVRLYQGKIGWPQARVMGINMTMYNWMRVIYGLVLFEGAYGVVSFIFDLPWWIDVALIFANIGMILGVYFSLKKNSPKFKPARFIALFLIPLSVTGTHTIIKLAPAMKVIPYEKIIPLLPTIVPPLQWLKRLIPKNPPEIPTPKKPTPKIDEGMKNTDEMTKADEIPANADEIPKNTDEPSIEISQPKPENPGPFPQTPPIGNSGYRVEFQDSLSKGKLGDAATAERLVVEGYKKLDSKLGRIHGIDGVYVRYAPDGELRKILIVENKVDAGRLEGGQMTAEWIAKRVDKMVDSEDENVSRTGALIRDNLRDNPDLVHKELWHHDLAKGETTISSLDAEAKKTLKGVEKFISNHVQRRCKSATTNLTCLPVN